MLRALKDFFKIFFLFTVSTRRVTTNKLKIILKYLNLQHFSHFRCSPTEFSRIISDLIKLTQFLRSRRIRTCSVGEVIILTTKLQEIQNGIKTGY